MKMIRRVSTTTETIQSTVILIESDAAFRFCAGCDQCGEKDKGAPDYPGASLMETLASGHFRVSGTERGVLVLCSTVNAAATAPRPESGDHPSKEFSK